MQRTRQQSTRRSILPTQLNNNKIPDCWKFGYKFIKGHLDNSPAKNTICDICDICKKIEHYAKVCRSEITPSRSETQTQSIQRSSPNHNYNRAQQQNTSQKQVNTRQVQTIQQSNPDNETIYVEENETETIEPKSMCYIREMMEDWSSVNFIQSLNFTTEMKHSKDSNSSDADINQENHSNNSAHVLNKKQH